MVTATARRREAEYRAIPIDSASTIKLFYSDPKAYYQKYVIEEPIEEEITKASLIGSIVHNILFDYNTFDEKFYTSLCEEKPTEKMLDFVNALYKYTILATDENGVVTKEFEEIAEEAYKDSGYKQSITVVLKNFSNTGAEQYYNELLRSKPKNLTVVSKYDLSIAEEICANLRSDEFVSEIINQETTGDISVYTELQLEGEEYKINGLLVKGMLDKILVYHSIETIRIVDLKVTWEPGNFYEGYYLYRKAYIQAYIYYNLIVIWAKLNGYENYIIEPPYFLVADSANFYKPLIYKLIPQDLVNAAGGFTHRGKKYAGVYEIIDNLKWARDNNEWKILLSDSVSKGIRTFEINHNDGIL